MRRTCLVVLFACALLVPFAARADDKPDFTRKEVIYGRVYGTALTMDVFTPAKNANGAGVLFMVSGGWYSNHAGITGAVPTFVRPFLDRGYAVFAVVHGSNPKFTIPEIVDQLRRAVRFVRHNAKGYGVDPDRLGVTGGSAGGHLSLMLGCASKDGDPKAADPVDLLPSRVAAVACFYPPTDFLNWGEKGKKMLGNHPVVPVRGAFDFREPPDPRTGNALLPVIDPDKRERIGRDISPITHATKDDAPTLIVHGDEDPLVPLQQAEEMIARLKEAGVEAELIVKKGGKHDQVIVKEHMPRVVAWFDKHLARKPKAATAQ